MTLIGDEMVARGARVLEGHVPVGTEEQFVRDVIGAAFSGVPLTNYGVGLALSAPTVDMVALINTTPGGPGLVLCGRNGEEDGFDTLPAQTHWQFGSGALRSFTVSKIGKDGGS